MYHHFERSAIAKTNGREMTHIARDETTNAKRFGERDDRSIDEAQVDVREASVDLHGTSKLTDGRRRVREGASGEILHEHLHRPSLIAKEVVDLGETETKASR
jgi:hypothetical protein